MAAPDVGVIHTAFDELAAKVGINGVAEHCDSELRIYVVVAIECQVGPQGVESHPLHWD